MAPSKPSTFALVDLDRNRRRLTRFQSRQISHTFPFLSLPAELRNIIYGLCLGTKGVEKLFDRYYARIKHTRESWTMHPPRFHKSAPAILLLCRHVFLEASPLLHKQGVSFHHGLLGIQDVGSVISHHALQRLSTITITTKGHPILQENILRDSWLGHMRLLHQLADILSEVHHLKKLTIDLTDDGLHLHTNMCWHTTTNTCDYREHLRKALRELRKIRGVGYVEILSIDPALARELKRCMESKPLSFMDLPGELRNKIYSYSADYSDISKQLRRTMSEWRNRDLAPPYPARTTPTILLLNKQIAQEASAVIYGRPLDLILAAPPGVSVQSQKEVPNILHLISRRTLCKIERLNLVVQSWEWMYSLDRLLPVLASKHSLKSFYMSFKDEMKKKYLAQQTEKYPDGILHLSLSALANIRGIEDVAFEGDLPDVYTQPLKQIMQSPKKSSNSTNLPTLKAICGNGAVVDADADDN